MEQEVSRWLHSQLGYNAAVDTTLSANCRGNLRALWEFVIANYKTADAARHVRHVLARHRRDQEAARQAPQRHREALARRERLQQLRTRAADLERALESLQVGPCGGPRAGGGGPSQRPGDAPTRPAGGAGTEAAAAGVRAAQPAPAARAAVKARAAAVGPGHCAGRCRAAGPEAALQPLQQQLGRLADSIMQGLEKAADDRVLQCAGALRELQPAATDWQQQQRRDQGAAAASDAGDVSAGLQQPLQRCKLLSAFRLGDDVKAAALALLQEPPGALWSCATSLAAQSLQEVSTLLDQAEGEMLAPLGWPLAGQGAGDDDDSAQHPDQQQRQLGAPSSAKHRLPWASGVSTVIAAAYAQQGIAPPPEIRVKMRQLQHVQLFVAAREAEKRGRAATQELHGVLGSTPLLQVVAAAGGSADGGAVAGGWEAQAAQLHIRVAGVLGQLAALQQYECEYKRDVEVLLEQEEAYNEKLAKVHEKALADEQLNLVLAHTAHDVFELFRELSGQQQRVHAMLQQLLAPCGTAAAAAAAAGTDRLQHEVAAVGRLPLRDVLAPAALSSTDAASSSNPVLRRTTLARLQLAAQQLLITGRLTTGGKAAAAAAAATASGHADAAAGLGLLSAALGHDVASVLGGRAGGAGASSSSSSRADAAAVMGLRGAATLDAVATARCPAALLMGVADSHQQLLQQTAQVEALSAASTAAATSSRKAASAEAELQQGVARLRAHERDEVLPHLTALLEQCAAARAFAKQDLLTDLSHLWEMPAMHLVPHRTHGGRSCSQWLDEVQALHARKRQQQQLGSGTQ